MNIIRKFPSLPPRWCGMGLAVALAVWAGAGWCADMPTLIKEALAVDPSILEARANEEVMVSRTEASRGQHYPVFGLAASQYLTGDKAIYGTPFRGVVGKVNVFAAGAISAAVARDEFRTKSQQFRVSETKETVSYTMAQDYLTALRSRDMLETEKQNLERHQKIIEDLEVVVRQDEGRRYELVQAKARGLQVRMRMIQYEKNMKLALSRLTRYTRQTVTLTPPVAADWTPPQDGGSALERAHPSLMAQINEAEAVKADQVSLQRARYPRVDVEGGLGLDKQRYLRGNVNWNFFDRSADYTAQSAAKQIVASQRRADSIERELEQRAATSLADMSQSMLQLAAAKDQVGTSEQVTKIYELQFKIGRRSLLDLLNAYQELSNVEVTAVTAANDYQLAAINYMYARAGLSDWVLRQP